MDLLITADKKALEVFVGCAPGCLWCECGPEKRLTAPWSLTTEPATWEAASAALDRVCTHAFPSLRRLYALSHLALPGEKMPRQCPACKKKPYETEREYADDLEQYAAARADTSKEGKARFKRERSTFAGAPRARAAHSRLAPIHASPVLHARPVPYLYFTGAYYKNYKHERPNLMINTDHIIPEIMHLDNLNVAKQSWTKGVVPLMSEYMREVTTGFFKSMKVKLDVKTKSDGRAGSAWFKASAWAEMVNGSNKVPSGLAPWLASLLFHIGADFVSKQAGFVPANQG